MLYHEKNNRCGRRDLNSQPSQSSIQTPSGHIFGSASLNHLLQCHYEQFDLLNLMKRLFWGILKSGENGGKCKEEKSWLESGQVLRESCARSARASGEHVLGWDVAPAVVCRRSPRDAVWMSEKQARLKVTARGVFTRCNIAFHHPPGMHRSVIAPPFSSFTRIISFLPCLPSLGWPQTFASPLHRDDGVIGILTPATHPSPSSSLRSIGKLETTRD